MDNENVYEEVTPEMAKMYAEEFVDNLKALKDGRTEDIRFSIRGGDDEKVFYVGKQKL